MITNMGMTNEVILMEFVQDFEEAFVFSDKSGKILAMNSIAKELLGDVGNIQQVGHLFSFDVCILDKKNIFNYNPLSEAFNINKFFKAEVLFEQVPGIYEKYILRTIKNSDNLVFCLSRAEKAGLKEQLSQLNSKIVQLEKDKEEFAYLKELAQNYAIRTGLVNKISGSIRESLDVKKIIIKALKEVSVTLGLSMAYFVELSPDERKELSLKYYWDLANQDVEYFNKLLCADNEQIMQALNYKKSMSSMAFISDDEGKILPRLVTPVSYQDKNFGVLVFYLMNNSRNWHEEEISLIEGIALHLASAINQAQLFETISSQKKELEQTLRQLKDTQAQLIQSEKMASLGQLVAGVAHEINTPLGAINSNNDIFSKCIKKINDEPNEDNSEFFEIIEDSLNMNSEAIRRINNIVKSLKNFARLDEAEYQQADINEGLKSTVMLLSHEIKHKINLLQDYGDLPLVKCYPNQLNQVFMNILINACQSIAEKGEICIKTEKTANNIIIKISDNGIGIAKENLSKIFDPGFTTKGVGVGTGLGLSICYQIIEKHNGKITVESNEGHGSSFTISLPVS